MNETLPSSPLCNDSLKEHNLKNYKIDTRSQKLLHKRPTSAQSSSTVSVLNEG